MSEETLQYYIYEKTEPHFKTAWLLFLRSFLETSYVLYQIFPHSKNSKTAIRDVMLLRKPIGVELIRKQKNSETLFKELRKMFCLDLCI